MLFVLMMFAECSYAVFRNGNELAKEMVEYEKSDNDNTVEWYRSGEYSGYVTGVADSTNSISWCPPRNVIASQIIKVVSKYLNNNPESLHFSAKSLVEEALKESFPCKK